MKLVKASIDNLFELQKLCREIYPIYFGNCWEGNGLELYLENQFGNDRLKVDLNNNLIEYYLMYFKNALIGFMKINLEAPLKGFKKVKTCELEKMYIHPKWKGKGFGKSALTEAINRLRKYKKSLLFLCVLETNLNSIAFYEKLGFKYHDNIILDEPFFKDELRGLNRMILKLK